MKNLILLLFLFTYTISFSQTKKDRFENTVDLFIYQFNESEYDDVFNTFSSSLQKEMTLEKLTPLLKSLQNEKGDIKESVFYKYKLGWASFKTYFERDSSMLKIKLDRDYKISGLNFSDLGKKINSVKKTISSDIIQKSAPDVKTPDTIAIVDSKKEIYIDNKTTPELVKAIIPLKKSNLNLPFREEWTVASGGDTFNENIHLNNKAQKNAFDFVITDENGKTFKTDGKTNTDYYAFGKEIIAPANAKVIMVVDGIPDNDPGVLNPMFMPGNTVILQTENKDFLFLSHFKQNSISVRVGESVIKNQLLGLSGNSGYSSEAHLHFHIQNRADMIKGIGIKAFFKDIIVNNIEKTNYSPLKGEILKNK